MCGSSGPAGWLWANAALDRELTGRSLAGTRLLRAHSSTRDQRQIKVGSTFAQRLGGARLGDAGGEETEIVGERAVGVVGDARAQNGDRLGR